MMTRPWHALDAHYADLVARGLPLRGMQRLVADVAASDLSQVLFGWTSMLELLIAPVPVEYPYDGPRLRIAQTAADAIDFRYIDTWRDDAQWHRVATPDTAFERLRSFAGQVGWTSRTL